MPPIDAPLLKSFTAACRRYGLSPQVVLEAFTGSLSVETHLFAGAGLPFLTRQVLLLFTQSTPHLLPLHPVKRERGIRYLRQMFKVERSGCSAVEKSGRHKVIMNAWLCLNGLHYEEKRLTLDPELTLMFTEYYLLLCDLLRRPPLAPVLFFMQRVVDSNEGLDTDCIAVQVLLYCAEAMGTTIKN